MPPKHTRLKRELQQQSEEPFHRIEQEDPNWWKPQPSPSLDLNHQVERPSRPLAIALSCRLCSDLLKEATTCSACGHTFCYDCISGAVVEGGHSNVCPVAGCSEVLGPHPFSHHKLKYDFMLDGIVRKVFPRPDLDAALLSRREQREALERSKHSE